MARCIVAGIVITYALAVIQTTIGSRLAVAGATPDLLLVWTICIGLLSGPRLGMLVGFASGALEGSLLQSLIGPLAISKGLGGFGAGIISTKLFRENWLVPGIAAALLTLVSDALFLALSSTRGGWADAARTIGLRTIYHALLAPIAFAAVSRARRAIAGARAEVS
jgi:rod shape-determining protein MreD